MSMYTSDLCSIYYIICTLHACVCFKCMRRQRRVNPLGYTYRGLKQGPISQVYKEQQVLLSVQPSLVAAVYAAAVCRQH